MSWDFLILGSSGIQGRITSRGLLEKGYSLFLSDMYREKSDEVIRDFPSRKTAFQILDVRNSKELLKLIKQVNPKVVVNCAEGDYNLEVYQACLDAEVSVVDLGSDISPTIKQLELDSNFKSKRIIGITGCGSTPGINNIMLKYAASELDTLETIEVGFAWDSNRTEFVPPFSIGSIIYELIFPAPYLEKGLHKEIRFPLGKSEFRNFRFIGKQECFVVDHPETYTFERSYKKKGIKNIRFYASFPKHSLEIIKTLINLGLTSEDDVLVEGDRNFVQVSPLDVLTQVLKRIRPSRFYKETEVLWVTITGKIGEKKIFTKMECVTTTQKKWQSAGCNIDTGLSAAIIASMIREGEIDSYGSFSPEEIVPEESFFKQIGSYGMKVYKNNKLINSKS